MLTDQQLTSNLRDHAVCTPLKSALRCLDKPVYVHTILIRYRGNTTHLYAIDGLSPSQNFGIPFSYSQSPHSSSTLMQLGTPSHLIPYFSLCPNLDSEKYHYLSSSGCRCCVISISLPLSHVWNCSQPS